ncbi:(LSU ribosomal protein L11P)-lysineN-methyltransferase [Mizugakiibacter sediminis]|uniref:Ribosomal protein L11 methyltransferase n=1 Tax=Mizugakiibacter sediminis TaxID=1475481 RepID=A0A0K8QL00_9GAMM|nr:50S ribosomal protein L11 methyltransferase [Mizugakiibacter sediminis]GAP65519.1 (LSU ribosomal protein L11P)-lysineN-methyltransferase [Mizugakiibacter sediminis]
MPFLELSLVTRAGQQPRAEQALEDLGAQAVTLLDAEDHPILEPAPGETPLWPQVRLQALFAADADRRGLTLALCELLPELAPDQLAFREVADQDWERVWMDRFQPMRFGRRLWIYPWNVEPPVDAGEAVVVRLDPGLAFGTGTHPTTALCLEWLDGLALAGRTVLDYGCGSGVLAIAALKLGAARAIGIDNDPQALTASRDNAERNGVAARLALHAPDAWDGAPADALVANILAGPLAELAPRFAAAVIPGAPIALSGILRGQEDELLARYAEWFEDLEVAAREDWVRIAGRRKAD